MVDQYNPAVAQKIITTQRQVEDELTAAVQAGSLNANDPQAVDVFIRGRMQRLAAKKEGDFRSMVPVMAPKAAAKSIVDMIDAPSEPGLSNTD